MRAHAACSAQLLIDGGREDGREFVQAVLHAPDSVEIPAADRVLYEAIGKMTAARGEVNQDLYDKLHAAGWTTGAIYEALSVCALFCFFNAWVDGLGVQDMEEEDYRASGMRLARGGYV